MAGNVDTAKAVVDKVLKALNAVGDDTDANEAKDDGTTGSAGSAPDTARPDPAPLAVRSGLDPMAANAVRSFRSTIRWMLAAFAAVAVVVFGSIPFADVTGEGRNGWLIMVGLVLAGVGVSCAIWATSKVLEPEDASLGELQVDLQQLDSSNWVAWMKGLHRWAKRRLPTTKALQHLGSVLGGDDGVNHFGPQHDGGPVGAPAASAPSDAEKAAWRVGRLVDTLGRVDRDRYRAARLVAAAQARLVDATAALKLRGEEMGSAWQRYAAAVGLFQPSSDDAADSAVTDGQGGGEDPAPSAPPSASPAGDPWMWLLVSPAQQLASAAPPNEVGEKSDGPPGWSHADFAVLWQGFRQALSAWRAALSTVMQLEDDARRTRAVLAAIDARTGVHLDRRDLIISDSGVSQIRGTFRLARWVLIGGVLATTIGVGLYSLGLPSGDEDDTAGDSVMRFTPGIEPPASGTTEVTNLRILGANGVLAACSGPQAVLEGHVVGDVAQPTTIIVTGPTDQAELEVCFGQWVLPSGSWSGDFAAGNEPPDTATTTIAEPGTTTAS